MYRATLACVFATGCSLVFPVADPSPDGAGPTDGQAPIKDGPEPDAVPLTCPADYVLALSASSASRYRLIATDHTFIESEAACEADRNGATGFTHLVVLDGDQERSDLVTTLLADIVLVGLHRANPPAFQPVSNQPVGYPPDAGFPWGIDEPTDGDDCAVLDPNGGLLFGQPCEMKFFALCECDAFAPH